MEAAARVSYARATRRMRLRMSTARVETDREARVMRPGSVPEEHSFQGQEDFRLRLLTSVVSASHVTSAHFSADFSVNH